MGSAHAPCRHDFLRRSRSELHKQNRFSVLGVMWSRNEVVVERIGARFLNPFLCPADILNRQVYFSLPDFFWGGGTIPKGMDKSCIIHEAGYLFMNECGQRDTPRVQSER